MRRLTKMSMRMTEAHADRLATDDEEKSRTYGWRVAEEQRSNHVVLRLDNRDAHTDYKAAHDYSDTYDMAVCSDVAHSHTALVGEPKNIFRAHEETF